MSYRSDPTFLSEAPSDENFVLRHWRGNYSLPFSWFLVGGLLSFLILGGLGLVMLFVEQSAPSLRLVAAASLLYFVIFITIRGWAIVGIWRSAGKHEDRGGSLGWAWIARGLVVMGLLGSVAQASNLFIIGRENLSLAMGNDEYAKSFKLQLREQGKEALLTGTIPAGATQQLEELLAASPTVETIRLESGGGRIFEAKLMADVVRKRGLFTLVNSHCESACTLVFLAGKQRSVSPYARIGFHSPSLAGATGQWLEQATLNNRADYQLAGLDGDFIDRIMATPAESMWYPTYDELVAAGVVTGTEFVVGSDKGAQLGQALKASADEINGAGPIQVDEITRRLGASVEGNTLIVRFAISSKANNIDLRIAADQLRPSITSQVCADQVVRSMIEGGATISFRYALASGGSFQVPVTRCT